jgi:type III secretion protein T
MRKRAVIDWSDWTQFKTFFLSLAWTQPRILAMCIPIPIFNRSHLPGMLRMAVAAGMGLMVAPTLMPAVAAAQWTPAQMGLLLVKEAFIGLVMGCLLAVPFWAFEALGFLMDNQRGATMGATLDPLTGNDSSPLGSLFSQAFIVFFFVSGSFLLLLELLYGSFALWDVFRWTPHLRADAVPVLIAQFMRLLQLALLLAAPAIVVMLLAEIGLAVISRFVPQLQVFFLAMPIKSALVLLVLALYVGTLFDYAQVMLDGLREAPPLLDELWRPAAPQSR